MKKYKYIFTGSAGVCVLGQTAEKPGDIIEIPVKNFRHINFRSADGGKDYPKNVRKLFGKGKGKKCLLIGRGPSSIDFNYTKYKDYAKIAVNPSKKVIKKARPDYIVYLENNYSVFINKNIDLFNQILIIANDLALNCEKLDYHYGRTEVIEGASSGFYALQIALKMEFDSLEIIGYDYYGDEYPKETFKNWLLDFKKLNLKNITNLNKDSKLKTGGES
jgi:hypothetical protein